MLARRSSVALLVCTLACNPDGTPVAPMPDPLEGITDLVVEGPTRLVVVGSFVDVRVLNGSDSAVAAAHTCWRFDVERQDDGAWVEVPNGIFGCSADAPLYIPAGQIYEERLRLPEVGGPGLYRLSFPHLVTSTGDWTVTVSSTFHVAPDGVAQRAP